MAPPPIKSVVVKTPKPTAAQKTQQAAATQVQRSARAQKILATDPQYGEAGDPWAQIKQSLAKPVKTDARGFVASPAKDSVAGLGQPKPPAARVKPPATRVIVHPTGKIEVHHTPTAAATPPASTPAAPASSAPASTKPVAPVKPVKPTRAPAAVAPAPGPGLTDQQVASQQVSNIYDPLFKQITDAENSRTKAQSDAIAGSTSNLAALYREYGPTAAAGYNQAANSEAAVQSMLQAALGGQASTGADTLAKGIASTGVAPEVAGAMQGQVAQDYKGEQGAAAARGASSLSALFGNAATAKDYAAKLPAQAGLYGLAATRQAQAQGTNTLDTELKSLAAQEPGAVQTAFGNIQSNRAKTQQLQLERDALGIKTKTAKTTATVKANTADTSLSKALGFLVNAQGDPVLKGGKIIELPKAATSTGQKANASLSKALGYVVDAAGQPILNGGKKIKVPAAAAKPASPASQAKALALARIGHAPGPNGESPVSWQTYLTTGLGKGIPAEVLIEQGRRVYTQAEIHQGLIPKG